VRASTFRSLLSRAPFRLLSIRAPRQAVLRTSSWLAPSRFTNRSCDLPVEKTRDASNRYLPPKQTVCTRTSCVPGSLSPLSQRGLPTESKAPCGGDRGTGRFTTSERPLRRIDVQHVTSCHSPHGLEHERGRFLPTALTGSSLCTYVVSAYCTEQQKVSKIYKQFRVKLV
jgi:hypothetical protein